MYSSAILIFKIQYSLSVKQDPRIAFSIALRVAVLMLKCCVGIYKLISHNHICSLKTKIHKNVYKNVFSIDAMGLITNISFDMGTSLLPTCSKQNVANGLDSPSYLLQIAISAIFSVRKKHQFQF